ncbi:hypothetical protein GALL_406820 [mine drainage metagenome]|uniref:Uncharacterized protein n=1 Tax=mine drainage metagenome TaxID=410659 RepID=A0A1J5Q2T6_9ZZZZ
MGEEQPARVRDPGDTGLGEVEAADLVGGAVAVLDRAQHAQPRVAFTLELAHDVDEVLEGPRARDAAVLGHVPDQHDGQVPLLRCRDQRGCDLTHLADAAGGTVDLGGRDRLHRVEHQEHWIHLGDVPENRREVRLGGEVQPRIERPDPLGAQPDLAGRLLAGHVQHARTRVLVPARPGDPGRDVEKERRLADAGLTGEQDDGTRDKTSAEHAIKFGDASRAGPARLDVDLADRAGRRPRRRLCDGPWCASARSDVFGHAAPGLALAAPADPLRRRPAALDAAVGRPVHASRARGSTGLLPGGCG